ncbi:MAG: YlmC/YmxH family sporulation protein [Clostridia bacterium]|nr:YlmC/YmxH family sporulation protein [Clostridia bacterium]
MMLCRIDDLRNKQVVCVKDGCVLGFISDVEMDTENGTLTSIIIFGRLRFFGLLGREEDIVIPWDDIKVIGGETVLVNTEAPLFLSEKAKKYG